MTDSDLDIIARRWLPGEPSPEFEAGVAAGIEAFATYLRDEDGRSTVQGVTDQHLSDFAEWATSDAIRSAPEGSLSRALVAQLDVEKLVDVVCVSRFGAAFASVPHFKDQAAAAQRFRAEARQHTRPAVQAIVNYLRAQLPDD